MKYSYFSLKKLILGFIRGGIKWVYLEFKRYEDCNEL